MRIRSSFAAFTVALCFGMVFAATSASATPSSDAFSATGAIDIAGTRGATSTDLSGKTREAGEPIVPGSNTDHTVWWRYIPAATGFVRFSTCQQTGSNPVPGLSLGLYTGAQVNLLTSVSQGTNNCPSGYDNAKLDQVPVTAGTTYWLQIGGSTSMPVGDTDVSLTMDFNAALPVNDDWANALNITGALPQTFAANNGLASVEAGEPRTDATNERQSLWYRWTATATGAVSINTCGSTVDQYQDSVLGVYTGTTPATASAMSFLDESDDACPGAGAKLSRVYVPVTSGTKYWIKLSNHDNSHEWGFPYSLQIKWITTPENSRLPSIYPTRFKVGDTTNADFDGSWGGYPTPTLARQWRRCDAAGANCTNISGATGASYTPVVGDKGFTIVLRVTASNGTSTTADSLPSAVVDSQPTNDNWANAFDLGTSTSVSYSDDNNYATNEVGEPTIGPNAARATVWYKWKPSASGTFVINNCLGGGTVSDSLDMLIGIRSGAGPIASTVTEGGGDNGCGPYHSGRTAMLFSAVANTTYWIQVATKSPSANGSFTLGIAIAGDPIVTVPPSISGTAAPGGVLNLDIGDWISPVAIAPLIKWFRCDTAGANCVDTGQSGTAYTVVAADAGKKMKATVTLSNSYGTVTSSALSVTVAQDSDGDGILDGADTCPALAGNRPNGCPPSVITGTGIPVITGNAVTGQSLSSTAGTWSYTGDPIGHTETYQWQRCNDSTPGSCSAIASATSATYAVVSADLGKLLRVAVTSANADDSKIQLSNPTAAVVSPPPAPANTVLPVVSGTLVVGQTLSTTNGTWTPAGVTFTYGWMRCTSTALGTCTAIPSQAASSYTLVAADLGKYIRSTVNGTNSTATTTANSNSSAIVLGDDDGDGVPNNTDVCPSESGLRANGCPPSDVVANGIPTISGPLLVGQTVSSSGGNWTVQHDPLPITVTDQWQRCDDATTASCSNIPGGTSNTYVLTAAEYGKRLRVISTATNSDDFATQTSNIGAIVGQTVGNTAVPTIVSSPTRVGNTLTTTTGNWVPADASFARSWYRCTDAASFGTCAAISGQTASSYTLVAADDGKYIRFGVTATGTNPAGNTFANSAASTVVFSDADGDGVLDAVDVCPAEVGTKPNGCLPSHIVGTGLPTINPTSPNVGQTVTTTNGNWSVTHDPLTPSFAYQWQRCPDTTPANCANIASATNPSYVVVGADYGVRIRVNVTGTTDDSATQSSAISGVISQTPANSVAPSATGTPKVGQVLTANKGTWTPADATFAYSWLRCTDNASTASCTTIASQTGTTYTLVAADDSKYIRIKVTGSTSAGNVPVTSAPTAVITTVVDGDGDGVPDASDTCPLEVGTRPNGCLPSAVAGTGVPTIGTVFKVGQTINASQGTWDVQHDPLPLSYAYQWQRCNDATVGSCSNISATSSAYVLTTADYGKRVRVTVTASNADDSDFQTSAISSQISQLPVNSILPSITGSTRVGQVLTGGQGTWTPADASKVNAWLRCTSTALGSCTPIASQLGGTYTLVPADNNNFIRLQVSATSGPDTVTATSAGTAVVIVDADGDGVIDSSDACPTEIGTKPNGCLPSDIQAGTAPGVTGNLITGSSLTTTDGTWTVLHDQLGRTITRQWQRCNDGTAASCSNIASATAATYVLTSSDLGKRVRSVITATNADDTASQPSAISGVVIDPSSPPVNNTAPTVSGTTEVGKILAVVGAATDWTPNTATLTFEWLRCTDSTVGSCTAIPTATATSYALVSADTDTFIRVRVTATAAALSTPVTSAASAKITLPVVPPPSGGTIPPPATPPVDPGPNLGTVTGPANLKTLMPTKKGGLTFSRVSVYCGPKASGNCSGSAVLTAKIGGKSKTIGTLKLSTIKGGGRTITVKLNSATMKALKKKSIKAQLTVTYTAPGYTPVKWVGKVTLKKPKA